MTPLRTPPGRYDPPRSAPSTRILTVASVALGLVGLVVGYLLYTRATDRAARGSVLGYTVVSDQAVDIRFEVRRPAGRAAVCVLRARDDQGAEVASEDVPVPATGSGVVRLDHRLRTRSRAATGEVDGCAVRGPRP